LNGKANGVRKKHKRAIIAADVRRFGHVSNKDGVLGTHTTSQSINIVRRPELVAELEAIGGDVVVVDSPDVSERIKAAVGQAELRLALDGVSGPATGVLAATLSPRGTLVSFAAMSWGPMSISPLDVIFKPVTMRGFFLGYPEFAAKLAPAVVQAAEMIASGRLHIPVAGTYPLSSIKEAIAHAQRGGKVLLDVAGSST
jgi:NADPH:quinone reductase-like Zn-dependent oxidoreductase